MRRRWSSFDQEITNKEAATLPSQDRKKLFRSMKAYVTDEVDKCVVKNYGDGLHMIKARGQGQGRCLYFTRVIEPIARGPDGEQVENLVALLFYKKETQDVPSHVLETARARRRKALNCRRIDGKRLSR